nr:MAG TPA: Mid2 like cell wall stress sensor [Caudoviricetes sp.]
MIIGGGVPLAIVAGGSFILRLFFLRRFLV